MDAIYARQSVEKADSLSIQGQIDLCRREVGDACEVYQDRGYSGKNTNRPAFQRLMEDVERGKVGKIIVYRLDRFSRSIADFGRLWEILKRHQVEFVSINETFDTSTPMGRAMLNIIMVFAQLERETTAERVRDNYYQRAKSGAWPGGPAPYGFSLGKLPGPDGRLAPGLIPDDRAAVVERIFTAYVQPDATLGGVARMLNEGQVPGPRRATWDNVSLSRILHNPLYAKADEELCLYYSARGVRVAARIEDFDGLHGAMLLGKRDRCAGTYQNAKEQCLVRASHQGLIPAQLWLRCQHKLDTNRQLGNRGRGRHTWLSGLLRCGCCGYSVKVNRDGEKYYLVCSGRSNLGVCHACIQADIRALEASVEGELEKLLALCPAVEGQGETAGETARALLDVEEKIQRLMSALAEGSAVTVPYINRAVERLEAQRAELLARQARPGRRTGKESVRVRACALTFEEKKAVAAQFIQEIRLSGDEAEVLWKV